MTVNQVRRASEADLAELVGLLEQLGYPRDPQALAGRLGSWTASTERDLLVAVTSDGVAGLLALTITPRLESDTRWAQVVALVTDHGHRRQGIGRDLLEHAERYAHERGCDTIVINSSRSRPDAHTFYQGLGYRDRCEDHAQYIRAPEPRQG